MIVDPDFLEHHKTRALVELTGDVSAPLAVIRLWGYCQTSKAWEFPKMTPAQLAALCRWRCRKVSCHEALLEAGFVRRIGKSMGFAAHEWELKNGKLIANWTNGPKGGRPKNGAKKGAQTEPDEGEENNPTETHRKPKANPLETDKIGSDRIGSDPKSNSGGEEGMQGKGAGAAVMFEVPRFELVERGAFPRELEPRLAEARRERALLRAKDAAWVWEERERKDYAESVAWYRAEIAKVGTLERVAKLHGELAVLESKRMERVKLRLRADAAAADAAWLKRIKELENALKGVR